MASLGRLAARGTRAAAQQRRHYPWSGSAGASGFMGKAMEALNLNPSKIQNFYSSRGGGAGTSAAGQAAASPQAGGDAADAPPAGRAEAVRFQMQEVLSQVADSGEVIAAGTVARTLERFVLDTQAYSEGIEYDNEDDGETPVPVAVDAVVTPRLAAALRHNKNAQDAMQDYLQDPEDTGLIEVMLRLATLAGDENAAATGLRCATAALRIAERVAPIPEEGAVDDDAVSPLSVVPAVCRHENALARYDSVVARCEPLLPVAAKSTGHSSTADLYLQYAHALYHGGRYGDAVQIIRRLENLPHLQFRQRNAAEALKQAAGSSQRATRHPLESRDVAAPVYVGVSHLFRHVPFLAKFNAYHGVASTLQLISKLQAKYIETAEGARPMRFVLDPGFTVEGLDEGAFTVAERDVDDAIASEFAALVEEHSIEEAAVCGSQRCVSRMNHILQSAELEAAVSLVRPERLWEVCLEPLLADVASEFPVVRATPAPELPPKLSQTL